jgi:CRISPR-associated protein Csm1
VRGRSFFLQLLADCVVRRLLFDLGDLPMTNALMVAGGNFLLLGPASVGNRSAEEIVQETSAAISRELIDRFEGDVALVTAAMPISQDELVSGKEFGNVFSQLKALEGRRKKQPLRDVALADDDGWYAVFGVHGEGGKEACVVCQREPRDEGERRDFQRKEPCRTCRLFEELAQDLAKTSPPLLLFECEVNPDVLPGYARALHDITGWACSVRDRVPADTASGCVALQTNQVAFDSSMTDGFRLLATHTPIVQESDAGWIKKRYEDHLPQDWARWPQPGDIRDFDMLAHAHAIRQNSQTPALARLGVLKMDVDNLGTLFMDRLSQKSLAFRLAVSDALSLFFDGYLSVLCQRFEEDNERPNSLYLLYGGGDDLFIVGEWDMLPALAQHIRDEFVEYAASPVFSVSAGIVLAEPKFPFYRAAELAEAALSSAKDYERANGPSKDAIGFLGAVLPWKDGEAWHTVATEHARLLSMAARIPRGSTIIRHVLHIYERWQFDRRVRQMPTIYFGPYMWLSAYQMSRLADQYSVLRPDTRHIQQFLLQPDTIALSGPAARWAELEYRMQHIGHEEGEA